MREGGGGGEKIHRPLTTRGMRVRPHITWDCTVCGHRGGRYSDYFRFLREIQFYRALGSATFTTVGSSIIDTVRRKISSNFDFSRAALSANSSVFFWCSPQTNETRASGARIEP